MPAAEIAPGFVSMYPVIVTTITMYSHVLIPRVPEFRRVEFLEHLYRFRYGLSSALQWLMIGRPLFRYGVTHKKRTLSGVEISDKIPFPVFRASARTILQAEKDAIRCRY
jgi:hypothetical protein